MPGVQAKLMDVRTLGPLRSEEGFEWEALRSDMVKLHTHARVLLLQGLEPTRFFLASSLSPGTCPLYYLSGKRGTAWGPLAFTDCIFGRILDKNFGAFDYHKALASMLNVLPSIVDRLNQHR